jgi:hypothetical protein
MPFAVGKLFDLHRRHAEQVNSVIEEAMKANVHDFNQGKLDPTCGLMTAFALGAQKAHRLAPSAADAEEAVPLAYTPTKHALMVLRVLGTATVLMQQADLVAATESAGTRLSERTIGSILQKLVEHKLVEYPEGPRSGVRITEEGRRLVTGADRASA